MIIEHNVPLYGVSIWSSRIVDPGLMTSLMNSDITYNHCRNFGAKYLGNETRHQDGFNVQRIGTCLWAIDCACFRWRHVTGWRHNGDVTFLPCDSMRCTVFVIVILSVRPSVTLVNWVHMVQPIIMISSPYGSHIILVSGDITFIPKFEGGHPERGRWMRVGWVRIGDFRPIRRRTSETVRDTTKVTIDH